MSLADQLADTWWHMQLRRMVAHPSKLLTIGIVLGVAWCGWTLCRLTVRMIAWHTRVARVAPHVLAGPATAAIGLWIGAQPVQIAGAVAYLAALGHAISRREAWHQHVTLPGRIASLRRRWRRVAAACQLGYRARIAGVRTASLHAAGALPRLASASYANGGRTLRLELDLPMGQTAKDVAAQSARLAAALDARAVTVTEPRPGRALVTVTTHDLPSLPAAPSSGYPEHITIGVRDDGRPWQHPTGVHTLVAGVTGAGKGSVMWAGIEQLAPHVEAGTVRLAGIDLKGGMELTWGKELFSEFATTPEDAATLLERQAKAMDARAGRMAGKSRKHQATPDEPVWLIVIDELASITAYLTDRTLKGRIDVAMSLILTKGRAPGWTVWAFLQDPSKEVLSSRQLYPARIGMRLLEPTQSKMLFGEDVPCELIPRDKPGTAYVRSDDGDTIIKVRANWVSDQQIRKCANRHAAPTVPDAQQVYFIRDPEAERIKIGISNDVPRRLKTLQTGTSSPLQLLGTMPGGRPQEQALHEQFAAARVQGEWFTETDDLLDYIEEHAA